MKNWKTTLVGAATAIVYGIIAYVQNGGSVSVRDLFLCAGTALLGFFAKDHSVSGTGA
ncbi:MAG: hypothetical protein M1510_00995 [Nitrospirae bacterium]|nr:hypothetical protein [Nitrospirota bacterium]MCL5238652.1 hypothetical protein [Nitrospirota bacterium]